MTDVKTIEHDSGLKVEIRYDDSPPNPRRDYDPFGTMACFHRGYDLGDPDHGYDSEDYTGWADMAAAMKRNGARIILPLYLIDHSGLSMRAGRDFSDCDPGGWDSGQVGFFILTAEQIREIYMVKRITAKTLEHAREGAFAAVNEYDQYLTGDVYYYAVIDEQGNYLDSCGGFFGMDYVVEEAQSSLDWHVNERQQKIADQQADAIAELLQAYGLGG